MSTIRLHDSGCFAAAGRVACALLPGSASVWGGYAIESLPPGGAILPDFVLHELQTWGQAAIPIRKLQATVRTPGCGPGGQRKASTHAAQYAAGAVR